MRPLSHVRLLSEPTTAWKCRQRVSRRLDGTAAVQRIGEARVTTEPTTTPATAADDVEGRLSRRVTGPLLFLFILGDVLGAGIYALMGVLAEDVPCDRGLLSFFPIMGEIVSPTRATSD